MTAARLVLALLAADPAPTLEESAQRVVDAANRVVTAADALAARPSTEPACDQVHPAQFTSVRELREGNDAISLFAPGDASVACRQSETAGRWVIGERSEIDFTFDYRSVEQRVSHLGRIDVSGRIISKDTVRPIEIPGYQEIGAPTFAVSQQTIEEEGLVAAFAEISAIATAIGECKSNLAGCPGDWYGEWFFTELFQHTGHYSELFTRILTRSDGLISPSNNADVSAAVLRKVILLARMGQEVLLTREATVTELGRSIAKAEDALDLARFNASYEWLLATVPDPLKDKQYCVPLSPVRPTVTCKREQLRAVCERLVAAWQLRCATATAPGNLTVLAEDQHTVAATLAVVSAARIAELKLLSPSELMDEAVWLIRRDEGFASAVNRPLSKADPTIDALVPDVPVLAAMYAQFEDLNRELKATRPTCCAHS